MVSVLSELFLVVYQLGKINNNTKIISFEQLLLVRSHRYGSYLHQFV
jgi:hypothetical protein